MRRRSTFLHDPNVGVDPSQLRLSSKQLLIQDLKAAREERLTFGFDELPKELWQVLKESHELHIHWASEQPYSTTPPFVSRTSPGLHIYFTPLRNQSGDLLCPLLRKVFSEHLQCRSIAETFSSPPVLSSRFASTASLQYHALLPSLVDLTAYIQKKICAHSDMSCIHSASLLGVADYVDIDYDSISHALTITAYWSRPPAVFVDPATYSTSYDAWTLTVEAVKGKVEVGVLSNEVPHEPSELQLSGFLTVVGEDSRPAPTLFSFPSRHHSLSKLQSSVQTYSVSFSQPTGLHPTMQISFPSARALKIPPSTAPEESTCSLHTYLTLPSAIFADKYQLATSDPLFLQSHNLAALRSISGETDLEAPDYIVERWGSNILLELATPPPSSTEKGPWNVTIPLHLRYLTPASGGEQEIRVPWPVVFWACTAEEGTKFPVNPFDRINLGYDGVFGPRTMFYHLNTQEQNAKLVETVTVPVLNTDHVTAKWLKSLTATTIILGFIWILWKLYNTATWTEAKPKVNKGKKTQ